MKKYILFPIRFVREAWSELKKVQWPTWKLTFRLSVLVVVLSLVFSVFISGIDLALKKGLEYFSDTSTPEVIPEEGGGLGT